MISRPCSTTSHTPSAKPVISVSAIDIACWPSSNLGCTMVVRDGET